MPIVNIGKVVSFASNMGVMVHRPALDLPPEQLRYYVNLAYEHIGDPPLVDACCGARGPLAGYVQLTFEEYLVKLGEWRIAEATRQAKRGLTSIRREQFNGRRSELALRLIESGTPYRCCYPGCIVIADLTIDHVVPLSRGGSDDLANLRFLCRAHNSQKSDKVLSH